MLHAPRSCITANHSVGSNSYVLPVTAISLLGTLFLLSRSAPFPSSPLVSVRPVFVVAVSGFRVGQPTTSRCSLSLTAARDGLHARSESSYTLLNTEMPRSHSRQQHSQVRSFPWSPPSPGRT